MGAMRRIRHRRLASAVGLVGAAAVGVVACQPTDGLSTVAVSYTTDQAGTRELQRRGIDVSWLTCTASYADGDKAYTPGKPPSPGASHTLVDVSCSGETRDRRDITIKGKVTREVSGRCVRGDLTAKVGGEQVFRLDVLGNCGAASQEPGRTPPVTQRPEPGPEVTVTVTKTIWCQGDPVCWPTQGK
ncbi:hypothetical protein [Streptomyces cavernae]|uniref:hypothetical protein n=1 Tax=Streptomyces cavernae TaxID=2259034 RepID=UPI00192E620E|nr:hypothetical protein [Streptomyces cavernae]